MNLVLDTNTIIYLQKGLLADSLPVGQYFVSVITEIELLSYPDLTPAQERARLDLLADVTVVPLDDPLKHDAIKLRRLYRLRVPDAIVAATARVVDGELLTNDAKLLALDQVRSRRLALLQLRSEPPKH